MVINRYSLINHTSKDPVDADAILITVLAQPKMRGSIAALYRGRVKRLSVRAGDSDKILSILFNREEWPKREATAAAAAASL